MMMVVGIVIVTGCGSCGPCLIGVVVCKLVVIPIVACALMCLCVIDCVIV